MDEPTQTAGETTLNNAIQELEKLAWTLNALVYGEGTPPRDQNKLEPVPADKLTYARNKIVGVNKLLREVADRLEIIGK